MVLTLLLLLMAQQGEEYKRGVALLERGQLVEASQQLRVAAQKEPQNAQVWKALGVVFAAQGDYREAEEPFRKACSLKANLLDACYYHGRALYVLNRFEEALGPLETALRNDAVKGRAETAMAESLEALGRNVEAEKRFQSAVNRRDAGMERALTAYGRFLIRLGRTEESLKPLQEAVVLNDRSPEAHYELGRAMQQLDRLAPAQAHLERAVALDPRRSSARLLLARVYRRLGRVEDAVREERAAQDLQSGSAEKIQQ